MTIDVEGLDYEIIKSNDWKRFKPSVLLIENQEVIVENIIETDEYIKIISLGYIYLGKTFYTNIFIDKDFYNKQFK